MVRPSKMRRTAPDERLAAKAPPGEEDEEIDDDDIPEKCLRFVDVITELPNGDATGATELVLSGRGYTTAEALESCKNLRKVDFKENHLSDLSFVEMNHQLCWLGVAKNRLDRIVGLANLSALVVLDLSDNRLTRLDGLSGLSSLKALIVARNRISRIEGVSPKKNPKLETLVLSNNHITECNMMPFKLLKKLSLANNKMHTFPTLTMLPQLTELRLNGNRLTALAQDLAMLPALSILDIGNNLLAKAEALAPLKGLLWMKSLNLWANPVAENMEDASVKSILATLVRLENLNNRRTQSAAYNHAKKKGVITKQQRQDKNQAEEALPPKAVVIHGRGFEGKKRVFGDEDDGTGHRANKASVDSKGAVGVEAKLKKKRRVPTEHASTSVEGAPKVDASMQPEPRRLGKKVKPYEKKWTE